MAADTAALIAAAEARYALLDAIHARAQQLMRYGHYWMLALIPAALTVVLLPVPLIALWYIRRYIKALHVEAELIASRPHAPTEGIDG